MILRYAVPDGSECIQVGRDMPEYGIQAGDVIHHHPDDPDVVRLVRRLSGAAGLIDELTRPRPRRGPAATGRSPGTRRRRQAPAAPAGSPIRLLE